MNYIKLLTYSENTFWKPPHNSLPCYWSKFSGAHSSLDTVKYALNVTFHMGFRGDTSGSQAAAFCKNFVGQIRRWRLSEEEYWMVFQNKKVTEIS
jgi:hypothetical protein